MKEEKLHAVYDENETCIFVGEAAETAKYLGCRKNQIFSRLSHYGKYNGTNDVARINFQGLKTRARISGGLAPPIK